MSLPTKIFGYEPAAIGALLQGIVPLLVFVHWWHLSGAQLGLLSAGIAAATAAYVALTTNRATFAVIIGAVNAGIALAAGFGAGLSNQESAAIIGGAGVLFAFFHQSQTTPKAKLQAAAALPPELAAAPLAVTWHSVTATGEPISVPVSSAITRPATLDDLRTVTPDVHIGDH